jgi:hypothetical protein
MKTFLLLPLLALLQPASLPLRSDSPLSALIVGGGPDLENNQVAIESNVRYVDRLLNPQISRRILFADGNPDTKSVLYEDANGSSYYRRPEIYKIDGPSAIDPFKAECDRLAEEAKSGAADRVLLYFTGHGNGNEPSNYDDNYFDFWNDRKLSVQQLASCIDVLPPKTPVTLVMVQCFSGSFGNLIFQDGDPTKPLSDRPICGFFAAVAPRMAAGCTASIKEVDYHDFTGYFFAALTGEDRMGRPVTGADYKRDGKITMSEAYAYALIHDDSIDTPTCTSDTFLRRFVKIPDADCFAESWSQIRKWATRAQVAALDALSTDVHVTGEYRAKVAYDTFRQVSGNGEDDYTTHLIRFVRLIKSVALAHHLRSSADSVSKARFEQLVSAEDSNPLAH